MICNICCTKQHHEAIVKLNTDRVLLSFYVDLQVELVDGVDAQSGRVELVYDGLRGTICNDHWDDKDASVICRMLGFG